MTFDTVQKQLEDRGFTVRTFASGAEAAAYLNEAVDGVRVGIGGSVTVRELGLFESLSAHNTVHWHWTGGEGERTAAMSGDVYLTSVNALAETGELINIDGSGNRVAATLFGHRRVYFLVGQNKLAPTYEEALWRARNIAAPKNAQRLGARTPCAAKGDRCYDCKSPGRICRGLVVLWEPMLGTDMEVLLIKEDLGY
ncbi:MAG: lactate utilization protein [Oscillibacter sp.]|nr:lactate utilization protein [Oscillibacter sp.]